MPTSKPKISVVIPTYNRCKDLERCLNSLTKQTFKDFEIIVIDNGSTDETAKSLKKYHVRVICDTTKNLSHLFNLGWHNAEADIVAYLNDDTEVVSEWLENIIKVFNDFKDAGAVGGPTIATRRQEMLSLYEASKKSKLLRFLAKIYEIVVMENKFLEVGVLCKSGAYSIGGSLPESAKLKSPTQVDLLSGTNVAIKKLVLKEIQGFDENFLFAHADGDLFTRMVKARQKLIFSPKVMVWHHINPKGATRSAYYLGRDLAIFYLKNIRPKTFTDLLRFTLNIVYFNTYWLYKAIQLKSAKPLRGIYGFASGFSFFIRNRG